MNAGRAPLLSVPLLVVSLACRAEAPAPRAQGQLAARATALARPLDYPPLRRDPVVEELHGVRVADPFRWLEEADSQATRAWVERQNALTEAWLDVPERARLRERLTELWSYDRVELPLRCARDGVAGGRTFVRRNDGTREQSVLLVADASLSDERLVLDPNTLSADGTLALVDVLPTADGELVACGFSDGGSDWRIWEVVEADTGARLADRVTGNKFGGLRWARDGSGFYYARTDRPAPGRELVESNAPPDIVFHRLGTDESEDAVVVPRPSGAGVTQGLEVGQDGRALFVKRFQARSGREEILRVPLDPSTGLAAGPAVAMAGGFDAKYDYVGDDGRTLWLFTDAGAPRRRVVAIDTLDPRREAWRTPVPEGPDAIVAAKAYGGHLVVSYLHDACARVCVFALDGRLVRELELPGLGSVRSLEGSWEDPVFHFGWESFVQPYSVYRHDLESGVTTAAHVPATGFDATPYVTRQVFYTSADGTRVPLFLTCRRDLVPRPGQGDTPTYLFGYGGFDVAITPFFSPAHLAWLELGGVLAVANLRGGGEYGEAWHRAGTKLDKQNVFDDFIAAAEWLIAEGYTRPERLAIGGRSNGGLLVGACLTQRPELFGVALPVVGVLDMLRYHLFTIGWAWAGDYGTAEDPEEFRALLAYSPLHNVRPGTRYPATFLSTAERDDRVVPAHSYKFAAALQAAQAGPAPVLLRVETRAGHGSGKPIAMQVDEAVDRWTFVVHRFGMMEDAR